MKNALFCLAAVCAMTGASLSAQAQTSDKERLKANLERAFSHADTPADPVPAPGAAQGGADGILYYVQVLSSVRPIEGTSDRALKTFPDLKSVREDRYLKYYTGPGTNDYRAAQALQRSVQGKGYPDAFVIAFKYGVKIPLKDALAQQGIK